MEYFVYNFQAFLLIFMRLHAMMIIAPLFSSGIIPYRLRALLAFFISLVMFPVVIKQGMTLPGSMGAYTILLLQEITIGLFIGFLAAVVFAAFQLSGQYFAVQIGFGISEVMDPLAQVSIPIIGQLENLIALLVFLYIEGHHLLIRALYRSYELVPGFALHSKSVSALMKFLAYSFSGMFEVALKLALPIVAIVFLVSVSLGILAKAAPQMNILMLGFPLKIIIALGLLALISPLAVRIIQVAIERTFSFISSVMQAWPV